MEKKHPLLPTTSGRPRIRFNKNKVPNKRSYYKPYNMNIDFYFKCPNCEQIETPDHDFELEHESKKEHYECEECGCEYDVRMSISVDVNTDIMNVVKQDDGWKRGDLKNIKDPKQLKLI